MRNVFRFPRRFREQWFPERTFASARSSCFKPKIKRIHGGLGRCSICLRHPDRGPRKSRKHVQRKRNKIETAIAGALVQFEAITPPLGGAVGFTKFYSWVRGVPMEIPPINSDIFRHADTYVDLTATN